MGRATLREVADCAGVSISTASLALNNKPGVREQTRARVLEAARKLDYHPNAAARSLANGKAQAIALVNPISLEQFFSSSDFFLHLSRGLYKALEEHNYHLFLLISEKEKRTAQLVKKVIRQRRVDGLVITNPVEAAPYLSLLQQQAVPHVFVGRPAHEGALYVDNDNVEIGKLGTEYLLSLGHKKIVFLTGPLRFTHCQDRLLGYRLALEKANMPFDESLLWTVEQKDEAIFEMVRERAANTAFTALFATSSLHAAEAIRACQTLGLKVPEDVSVICIEDSFTARYCSPPLTVIELNSFWLGHWAGKLLLCLIKGENPGSPILLPGKLVVRNSASAPKKRR
ncbi:MAG: LacI family DNA-binding transcriptional regulator [Candidatus Hadarchaeum sp.]|uniref:LacI family DNA-binding transcriptional regulator n=1 Tax=Candidatus Hadarchaeum sp. TaxID=2883567 RepID=UPI0031734DDD